MNAGALFADDCPLWQSRLYCTRWDGKEKSDAINDAEFTGNVPINTNFNNCFYRTAIYFFKISAEI